MKLKDFDYKLPEELIAQTPLKERSASRLLKLNRENESITHHHFYDVVDMLGPQDVLVVNDTKVLPSRIYGTKEGTGAHMECLLLKETISHHWEVLIRPARRAKIGSTIVFSDRLRAIVKEKYEEGLMLLEFIFDGIFLEILEEIGKMPLPPYIHEILEDQGRYQTVYAKALGSAASPTAGLHFTDEILQKLRDKGVEILHVTLHVGLGTFRPVNVEDVQTHKMHKEYYEMSKETAERLNLAKQNKKRIIAVGTTSVRTLESVMKKHQTFCEDYDETDIFIYPPFTFQAVDAMFTNFHLPKSTLMMLVSAFSNREFIMRAYQEAIQERYRFFSFGDAMFIE